jgi:hypothetical protein
MGRTVYGVDLEESPFGGLIEKLLTEEELEKFADGGVATGRDTAPDGGSDDEDADDWSVSDSTGYGRPDSTGDSEFGDAGFDDADAKDGGGIGSVLSTHKWLLLKVAVASAVLATVLVVVWRYRGKLAGVVPGRGDADGDRDVSPARRRAKVDDEDEDAGVPTDESEGVTTPGQDVDLGALLGLGFLAFVAALVRKFDEERTRPHDPLVDGPLDENEDAE